MIRRYIQEICNERGFSTTPTIPPPLRGRIKERGLSAVLAVFALLLFSVLGLVVCSMLSISSMGSLHCVEGQQVLQIAEAGRQYGIWRITNNEYKNWVFPETSEKSLGSGTYTLEVDDNREDKKKVIKFAKVGAA